MKSRTSQIEQSPKEKRIRAVSLSVGFFLFGIALFTFYGSIKISRDIADTDVSISEYQEKIDSLEAENVELNDALSDKNAAAYMEKVAKEQMDYAYPGEVRYYDISH